MSQNQTRIEFEQELRVRTLKDPEFRKRLLDNPKAAIKGITDAPKTEDVKYEVSVYEETANTIYLVIPGEQYVNAHNELSEAELEAIAGGGTPALVATVTAGIWGGHIVSEITKW